VKDCDKYKKKIKKRCEKRKKERKKGVKLFDPEKKEKRNCIMSCTASQGI